MGGEDTIKKLREIDGGMKAIVSSGYSSDPIMADAGKYCFVWLLVKPYRLSDLSETVYRVITMERQSPSRLPG
jgi:two-component system cell cycle sensor histidine kinase/response regulator CckA